MVQALSGYVGARPSGSWLWGSPQGLWQEFLVFLPRVSTRGSPCADGLPPRKTPAVEMRPTGGLWIWAELHPSDLHFFVLGKISAHDDGPVLKRAVAPAWAALS